MCKGLVLLHKNRFRERRKGFTQIYTRKMTSEKNQVVDKHIYGGNGKWEMGNGYWTQGFCTSLQAHLFYIFYFILFWDKFSLHFPGWVQKNFFFALAFQSASVASVHLHIQQDNLFKSRECYWCPTKSQVSSLHTPFPHLTTPPSPSFWGYWLSLLHSIILGQTVVPETTTSPPRKEYLIEGCKSLHLVF